MTIPPYKPNIVEGKFNISPSSIGTFMQNPKVYYERYLLGMKGETNTNLLFGTIIHNGYEQYINGDKLTHEDVEEYIEPHIMSPDVDAKFILGCWEDCLNGLIAAKLPKPDKIEYQLSYESTKYTNFAVGGSVDGRYEDTIYDLKTTTQFKKEIPASYRLQLMTYSLIERLNGNSPKYIEIVWIKKPSLGYISDKTGKLIGVKKTEVQTVREEITEKMWVEVKDYLSLMFKTIGAWQKDNSLAEILFRENKESFIK